MRGEDEHKDEIKQSWSEGEEHQSKDKVKEKVDITFLCLTSERKNSAVCPFRSEPAGPSPTRRFPFNKHAAPRRHTRLRQIRKDLEKIRQSNVFKSHV